MVATSSWISRLGEPAGDLVEQQHRGSRGQGPGQLEALAIEQVEAPAAHVGLAQHAGALERLDRGRLATAPADAAPPGDRRCADEHVLEHGQPDERPRDLRRAADAEPAAAVRRQPRHVAARRSAPCPRVGPEVAGHEVQHRRLAGPVRADDAERLTRRRARS